MVKPSAPGLVPNMPQHVPTIKLGASFLLTSCYGEDFSPRLDLLRGYLV